MNRMKFSFLSPKALHLYAAWFLIFFSWTQPGRGDASSFSLPFDESADSLTNSLKAQLDAPLTTATWAADAGVGGGGGVVINNTGAIGLFYRPTPVDDGTSTVNFALRDAGSTYETSLDFRFFNTATNLTTVAVGFADSNEFANSFTNSAVNSLVAFFQRLNGTNDIVLRYRNNNSNTATLQFPQSALPNGHWFRLRLVVVRDDVVGQFSYTVELLHLGADGMGIPTLLNVNDSLTRLTGTRSNTVLHLAQRVFIGFDSRRSSTVGGGVTVVDNFRYTVTETKLPRFDWSNVPEIYPGIQHAQLQLTEPRRLFINVLRIDSHHPDIRFTTTGRHPNWAQQMSPPLFVTFENTYFIRTGRQRTRDFLIEKRSQGMNAVAAINAAPWSPWSELGIWSGSYQFADRLGLAISHGELVDIGNGRPSLVVEKDWTLRLQESLPDTDVSNILHAVSGFQFVLQNGLASGAPALEPRTGYGLCQENRFLILMTIDGRQTISEGVGTVEVGRYLRYFGAWSGMNMDGGGSTTMALRDPVTSNISIVNSPSESPRSVGNNLAVYYVDPANPEPITLHDWLAFRRVPPGLRGPADDANGDGIPNLLAYAFNIDPSRAGDRRNGASTGNLTLSDIHGERLLSVDFRLNRHAVDLDVDGQLSQTLQPDSWFEPANMMLEPTGEVDPLTKDPVYRATIDVTNFPKAFFRLRVQSAEN